MARTGTDIFNADANHDYSNPNNMFWASYNVLGFPIFNKPPYSISSNPFPPPAVKPCASCSDMYVNAQYLQDMSANPIFRIYMYEKGTGNNVQYHTWTSNIKYKDGVVGGNTNGVYFENSNYQKYIGYNNKFNTGNQWWIGWGSPQSEILIYDSFFDAEYPRECLIKSGHNQALNVNSEKVAFQIERSWGNERGDEFVKRQFYIKPRKNITNVTSALGVVKNEKTVTVSWNFPYSSTSGEATHFSVELFDQDNNNTRVYYREVAKSEGALVSNSGSERKFTLNTVNTRDLTPSHNHRLVITPYYKYKGTNYRFTDVYVSVNNFVRFEPRPTGAISITAVSPKIRRDEKNFKIAFTYNNNAPSSGIASKFAVRLFDGNATYNVGEVSNSSYANTTQGTKSYEITANIQGLQISTSSYYTVGITPIYVGKNSNLGGTEKTATNFVQRNPIPQGQVRDLAVKVNDSYVIVPSVELGGTTLDLKWVFDDTPQSDKGVTSGYKLEFTSSGHTTRTYYVQDKSKSINMSDFDFGATYSLTITPYYEIYGDKRYGTSKEYSSYFTRNGGLKNIQRVSPANINPAKWFFGVEAENEYPVFRIAFVLPEDYNYQYMTPQQKASYEYASLVITYTGETSVTKTYTLADNSTEEDPTYICVSGDGHLTHQNSVIIDLTDINIQPATEGTGDDEKKYYEITVTVTSPYGTTVSTSYKIYLEDFPLILSDEEGGYPIGSFITAESMNKFIEARNIVSTFTDGSLSALVVAGNIIKYSDLESLVEPINVLYDGTKDWSNIKKYVFPRAIALNGTLTDDIPAYQKAEESSDVYDHIFAISDEMTSLTQLSEVPADYAEAYNEYFQQPMSDHPYTFRSMNANNPVVEVGEDLPLFSAPEYNMSWSYYMLYRKLHTSTRFADKYLVQSTKTYASDDDTQSYGGWVSIPDVELKSDYKYVLDALLVPSENKNRKWTAFGGSYGESGGVKQGMFASFFTDLRMYTNSNATASIGTPIEIETGVRKTYTFEGLSEGGADIETENGFMILAPKDYSLIDGKILGAYTKIDSLYGEFGRFFGLEIYDGSELIHKFIPSSGKCPYIKPINPDEEDSVGGFIPVLTNETNMQLNYGDVFIFDFEPHTEVGYEGSSTGCFIGGSIINDHGAYAYDRYWGIHVGYKYYTSNTTITLAISSYRDNSIYSNYVNQSYVSDTRQIMAFTMQNPQEGSPLRNQEPRTDGGFFLFGYREFDTGNAQNGDNFVRCLTAKRGGKFYRITVKKADGSLKYDFVPESNGGQVGMRDLVTDTFYPANDSSLFEYGEDDYYGVTDKVTGKFYHCNDNSKFYLLKEGEEPPVLNSLFLGSPTPEETPSDDAEEPTEPSEDE